MARKRYRFSNQCSGSVKLKEIRSLRDYQSVRDQDYALILFFEIGTYWTGPCKRLCLRQLCSNLAGVTSQMDTVIKAT